MSSYQLGNPSLGATPPRNAFAPWGPAAPNRSSVPWAAPANNAGLPAGAFSQPQAGLPFNGGFSGVPGLPNNGGGYSIPTAPNYGLPPRGGFPAGLQSGGFSGGLPNLYRLNQLLSALIGNGGQFNRLPNSPGPISTPGSDAYDAWYSQQYPPKPWWSR